MIEATKYHTTPKDAMNLPRLSPEDARSLYTTPAGAPWGVLAKAWRSSDKVEKRPLGRWADDCPALEEVLAHLQDSSLPCPCLGIRPGDSGLLVVDIDKGDWKAFARTFPPLAISNTSTDAKAHLIYHKPEAAKVGNSTFELGPEYGSAKGEIRCDSGWVMVWQPAAWRKALILASSSNRVYPPDIVLPGRRRRRNPPGPGRTRITSVTLQEARVVINRIRLSEDGNDYDDVFLPVIMGTHDEFRDRDTATRMGALAILEEWSARTGRKRTSEIEAKWRDLDRKPPVQDGITWGTVVHLSRSEEHGIPIEEQVGERAAESFTAAELLTWAPARLREAIDTLDDLGDPLDERIVLRRNEKDLAKGIAHLGLEFRNNTRHRRMEVRQRPTSDEPHPTWHAMTDNRWYGIHCMLHRKAAMRVKTRSGPTLAPYYLANKYRTQIRHGLADLMRYDPAQQFFDDELPRWDGVERIEGLLERAFIVPDEEDSRALARWISRFLFIGAIQRTYQPGCKLDEVPVIVGPQGCGKSELLEYLLPPHLFDLFGGGLNFSKDTKVMVEALLGKLIVEASEMADISKANVGRLKAFITSRDDGSVRLAYARSTDSLPRACIIVGTANGQISRGSIPNDPTGNRRFVSLEVRGPQLVDGHPIDMKAWLRDNRMQCWAEARAAYMEQRGQLEGRVANMPRSLYAAQRRENEKHRVRDEEIEGLLDQVDTTQLSYRTVTECLDFIRQALAYSTSDNMPLNAIRRLGSALKVRGFDSRVYKIRGKGLKLVYHPDLTSDDKLRHATIRGRANLKAPEQPLGVVA